MHANEKKRGIRINASRTLLTLRPGTHYIAPENARNHKQSVWIQPRETRKRTCFDLASTHDKEPEGPRLWIQIFEPKNQSQRQGLPQSTKKPVQGWANLGKHTCKSRINKISARTTHKVEKNGFKRKPHQTRDRGKFVTMIGITQITSVTLLSQIKCLVVVLRDRIHKELRHTIDPNKLMIKLDKQLKQ